MTSRQVAKSLSIEKKKLLSASAVMRVAVVCETCVLRLAKKIQVLVQQLLFNTYYQLG